MLKYKSGFFAAGALVIFMGLGAATAEAHQVTYVSGKGSDSNDCFSPVTPCRTFQRAVNQAVAGGEVKALDPADYSPVTINKSITITGVPGAGIDTQGGTAISILEVQGVQLDNLVIKNVSGSNTGNSGVSAFGTERLTITHCKVRGFTTGISLGPLTGGHLIADSIIAQNQTGIFLGKAFGTLDHVVLFGNGTGASLVAAGLTVVDTIVTDGGTGFDLSAGSPILAPSRLSVAHSTIETNTTGINLGAGSTATSFGDNHIKNNGTDVKGGTLTNVGTQ